MCRVQNSSYAPDHNIVYQINNIYPECKYYLYALEATH